MKRKTKILLVVLFICFVAAAMLFGPGQNQSEVLITYGGVVTNQSIGNMPPREQVFFNITNTSRQTISCFVFVHPGAGRPPAAHQGSIKGEFVVLQPFSQTNCTVYVPPVNQWRLTAHATAFDGASPVARFRAVLMGRAFRRGWNKVGQWISPLKISPAISGPLMNGNQPATDESERSVR